jgi:ribonuclease T2
MVITLAAIATALAPAMALAQALQCSVPPTLPRLYAEGPTADQPRRLMPIGGYTLALSWSPQYCATAKSGRDVFRCARDGGKFGFTLHGLWPDGLGKQWPQYCRPARPLAPAVIRSNLCVTPDAQLIQHEWAKHGTCVTTRPAHYFDKSRALYGKMRFPDMGALARRRGLTAGAFAMAFAQANRRLKPGMMRITTTKDGWLDEVWLCLDKRLASVQCEADGGGVRPSTPIRIRRP